MMLKANGEYLDFNGDIDVESQIKLFEEIEVSRGDFSYDIEIQDNGLNRKILGIPRADTVKTIYQAVPSEVIDDTGQSIYTGKLQVNRIEGGIITATFFAGNTEWFSELSEPLSSLPLYKFDVNLDSNGIYPTWFVDEGIVFPIMDAGALVTRSYPSLKIEDFVPCFYVKTLFNEIFNPKGIKVQGDFIDDVTFTKLIVASNGRSQDDIDSRSSYVNKTSAQNSLSSLTKVTFQDETTFPFIDGSQGNFASSTYTADVKMVVDISISILVSFTTAQYRVYIYKNGVSIKQKTAGSILAIGDSTTSLTESVTMNSGDTLEVYVDRVGGIGTFNVNVKSTIRITPTFIYRIFGKSSVPKWTQAEFVSNILRLFNVLPSYNPVSKTLTLDLFNNIKNKEYVDLSDEVVIGAVDFTELVSSYAKNNIFKYQESDNEDLRQYNISNFISYGSGNLTIDNDYIENSKNIIESDFTTPITYLNGVFDMSMERFNFVELDEIDDKSITSVTDAAGTPRFNISNADDLFTDGDLIRISDSTEEDYNGEWIVNDVTTTYITLHGVPYTASATGTATLLRHKFTTDDNVYLFINIPSVMLSDISSIRGVTIDDSTTLLLQVQTAYFNLLSNGRAINNQYKQSLSFGNVNDPLNYQLSLLDTYWPLFSRIMNNPVMLPASGYLKKSTFEKIKSFLRPVMIRTEETTNLYYMNRNKGYKGSERPCELELIKLN